MRIRFKNKEQKDFLVLVMKSLNCPSIKELSNRLDINYSSLKNYFNESRLISYELFKELCFVTNINKEKFNMILLNENWGKIKGGKISKKY